jgi:hypothetical protein
MFGYKVSKQDVAAMTFSKSRDFSAGELPPQSHKTRHMQLNTVVLEQVH